jgi:hypothetical protein
VLRPSRSPARGSSFSLTGTARCIAALLLELAPGLLPPWRLRRGARWGGLLRQEPCRLGHHVVWAKRPGRSVGRR